MARANPVVAAVEEDLDYLRRRCILFRNILQALILESGINWASHQDLRDVITGARDPLVQLDAL